jgi:hypothetical protein
MKALWNAAGFTSIALLQECLEESHPALPGSGITWPAQSVTIDRCVQLCVLIRKQNKQPIERKSSGLLPEKQTGVTDPDR